MNPADVGKVTGAIRDIHQDRELWITFDPEPMRADALYALAGQ